MDSADRDAFQAIDEDPPLLTGQAIEQLFIALQRALQNGHLTDAECAKLVDQLTVKVISPKDVDYAALG